MSMASFTTSRMPSVSQALTMAPSTDGFSPEATTPAVKPRAASMAQVRPKMRASGSSMPSNLAIGIPNCSRTKA